jgi:hypothetical protein
MTLVNNRADVPVTFGETARGHRNCVQRANFRLPSWTQARRA